MIQHSSITRRDDANLHFCGFHHLMPHRVQNVLLVSSLYESFILEEEGLVAELITSEFVDMNLTHAPRVTWASTVREALDFIRCEPVDLVITMTRLGQWNLPDFAEAVKEIHAETPVVVLVAEPRELPRHPELHGCPLIERVFVWSGDPKILLGIVKFVEDRLNAEHDTRVGDVRTIILVENSVRFYSTYLPLIYGEVVKLTQSLMSEGVSLVHRLLRQRARPKILLAETFEEACDLYHKFSDNLLGVISDIRFPKNGKLDDEAGIHFIRLVREQFPHLPVLMQSSDQRHAETAASLRASFLNKNSGSLLHDLRSFLLGNLGFGEFVFGLPDGREVGRAHDLKSFEQQIAAVADESILFHARNNHFSNWLMARTEFELAARIRPRKVTDFASVAELRSYLLNSLAEFRMRSERGMIAEFSAVHGGRPAAFVRVGGGSIGGKARGLAFINALIRRYNLEHRFDNVRIFVPSTAAIGTEVFDDFLERNNLHTFLAREPGNADIADRFVKADLPAGAARDLAAFLGQARFPLAVRSSSLLEDSQDQPFAGVYTTHMLPNNHPDFRVRMVQLGNAIKLVYASTFLSQARSYLKASGRHAEEERMGVVLQRIVGSQYGSRFYPTFSGVVRSYNYYPAERTAPEDGVASVALGLGKMVVEGGQTLLFCPARPDILSQFPTIGDLLTNSQREFFALDVGHPDVFPSLNAEANLHRLGLAEAEADGTLAPLGSVYSPENDVVYDGILRDGPRLVTFAHVLKAGLFPLAEILRLMLKIGHDSMACPVEIEFAVNMNTRPMEFGCLQIRPIISQAEYENVCLDDVEVDGALCWSPRALGNGRMQGVYDIVYVKPDSFDAAKTHTIASEIARLNDQLFRQERKCVLIGPGRWGTADHWLGIPVTWDQISSAQVLIETTLQDFMVTPSQGTHFFHNLTSLGAGYFSIDSATDAGFIDWAWLKGRQAAGETRFLRHVHLDTPLDIRIDGRTQKGVILKPVTSL